MGSMVLAEIQCFLTRGLHVMKAFCCVYFGLGFVYLFIYFLPSSTSYITWTKPEQQPHDLFKKNLASPFIKSRYNALN